MLAIIISSGENVRKIQNKQVVFASFAHLSGSIITLFGISLGFTTNLLTKFDLNSYLQLLSQNKVSKCVNDTITIRIYILSLFYI